MGKIEVDKLIAARARALGDQFTLKAFFEQLNRTGLIPITLVRRELTEAR
jgi:uncharacterized protein (DUF885 family)